MKHTIDSVREIFQKEGYTLLTSEYKNAHQYLEYICPNGHRGIIRFCSFYTQKCRCKICKNKNLKVTLAEAKLSFEEEGCVLLSKEIKNNKTPLSYICSCGNKSWIRWYDFRMGKRCKKCGIKKRSGENSPRWNPDRNAVLLNKKLADAAHTALKTTMKCLNLKKNGKTYAILGYGVDELKAHIEKHIDWEFVKDRDWSLDHIFPIKAFVDFRVVDIRLINSLDNLRPVELKENMKKSAKYSKEEFAEWLKEKGHAI